MKKNCFKYYEIFNLILNILLHFQFLPRQGVALFLFPEQSQANTANYIIYIRFIAAFKIPSRSERKFMLQRPV